MNIGRKDIARFSDEELIKGCENNEPFFQEVLYKKYSSRLMVVCLRYAKNQEEAEDIFHEAFVKIFQNIHTFRKESSLETWMRRIMANTALKHLRKAINKIEHIGVEFAENIEDNSFDHTVNKLSRDEMLKMIESMPDGYRTVFNMYAFEGYSHKEIASQLEISENTSKSQLARARKYLQNLILQVERQEAASYERNTKQD